MNKLSPKNKIYVAVILWAIVSLVMFSFVFGISANASERILAGITAQKQQLATLNGKSESYSLAQQDLQTMAQKPIQPDAFFSKDITLVKEIETLENLSQTTGVTLALSGVAGTTQTAPRANTLSNIVDIPYGITLQGPFPTVVDFIQSLENLDFITNITAVSPFVGKGFHTI